MKPIKVADQPRLGLLRTVRITIDGIRYRLFRAIVTVAVIAMAVAFLMNIMSESLLKRSVGRNTPARIARKRLVYDCMARLTQPGELEGIIVGLAEAEEGGAAYREAIAMGGSMTSGEIDELHRDAVAAAGYLEFFSQLDYARHRSLVHAATGIGIFDRLADGDEGWTRFSKALATMRTLRDKPDEDQFRKFLRERWPTVKKRAGEIRQGRVRAIAKVAVAREKRTIQKALTDTAGEFGEDVRAAGFVFDEGAAREIADQASRILETRQLEAGIRFEPARQIVARYHNILLADVAMELMWESLLDRDTAAAYLTEVKRNAAKTKGADDKDDSIDVSKLTTERVVQLARLRREEMALANAVRLTAGVGSGWMGLGERMGWLMIVSMLVCMIGISNAMLMTVTERFREIATLKCLGALDGFIMLMFVLESCVLGAVGGIMGAVLGCAIGLGRMLTAFGFEFITSVPLIDLLVGMTAAVAMGVALAAIAAVYPALKAARLAPMEAMRIE